ncbi:hypothetical protein V497_04749 [Pseudogymnoascus sp. VKM F-4516 (FW-969)]|nr:hypothetical protein V497_04749 [Pseudogymnoascus sp. VKM F-4516 (FW-969)]
MAQHYGAPPDQYGGSPQNLQFYPSSYPAAPHDASAQGGYGGYGAPSGVMGGGYGVGAGGAGGFSSPGVGAGSARVSGRMGEQGGLRTGWLAAFSTEGYEGEPPLQEELGVNFGHIKAKTLAVLNPFVHIDRHIMDDSDLAGPILFFFLFGTFLLFSGKVHFGYIYGLALMGSTALHTILSLMTPDSPDGRESPGHMAPGAHERECAGILSVAAGVDVAVGDCDAIGLRDGIRRDEFGNLLVDVEFQRDVLCYRADEECARPRRIPCGAVLRGLRDYVHLQQPGERVAWESGWYCDGVKGSCGGGGFMTGSVGAFAKHLSVGVVQRCLLASTAALVGYGGMGLRWGGCRNSCAGSVMIEMGVLGAGI